MTDPSDNQRLKKKVGFALLSKDRLREVSAKGGAAVPADARSFSTDRDAARAAGRKGGTISRGGGRHPADGRPGVVQARQRSEAFAAPSPEPASLDDVLKQLPGNNDG